MKPKYRVVIRTTREDGAIRRRIIRRGLLPELAEAVRARWSEKFADRPNIAVITEIEL